MTFALEPGWTTQTASHPGSLDRLTIAAKVHTCQVDRQTKDRAIIDEVSAPWRDLAVRVQAPPFLRPEWIAIYLETFEPDATIDMITVRREGLLIGILPLIRERGSMLGVPVRRLRAPVSREWPDRFDILCDPDDDQVVVEAIWNHLATRSDWDVIELADLPEGGPGWSLMRLAEERAWPVGSRVNRRSPFIPIPEAVTDPGAVAPETSAHFRANLRRRKRRLAEHGPVEVHRTTTFDPDLFEQFLNLEDSGWKGAKQTSIRSLDRVTQYYRSLIAMAAANGYLAIYTLEAGGETIAMHLGIALFGRYFVPKLAFDESHHEYGPGHLLVNEVLQDCAQRGYSEFDFLGDEAPWKREWTDHVRLHYRAHIFSRSLAARTAYQTRYRICPFINRSILRKGKTQSGAPTPELETAK